MPVRDPCSWVLLAEGRYGRTAVGCQGGRRRQADTQLARHEAAPAKLCVIIHNLAATSIQATASDPADIGAVIDRDTR